MRTTGTIVARRPGVIAGTYLIAPILREYQVGMESDVLAPDGACVDINQPVARVSGAARTLLSAERVLLNFLCHLSGVASATRKFVDVVEAAVPAGARRPVVCDTRKTTPGFRALDKYAVRCGGGVNHRMGLYDGVMLKDNHLAALKERLGAGLTLAELTSRIRAELDANIPLWLEVDTLEQLREALPTSNQGGADIILLDNFTPAQMKEAVRLRDGTNAGKRMLLEASGGITLENLAEVARTGVDRISVGALTHSAPVMDLSMELQ
jgi:nicotinate-nucleotide pyrophosphorylase (carboxylating)